MNVDDYRSIRELDETLGMPKGTAFRLFKRNLESLNENEDFVVLYADSDAEVIARLKAADRLYSQSRNVVLLSPECFELLLARHSEQ